MEHTKEPWTADGSDVVAMVDQYPTVIADCLNHESVGREDCDANARRIVACVNACAGTDNETLHQIARMEGQLDFFAQIAELKQQRDDAADSALVHASKYNNVIQAITDPENQPSQYGTVTLGMYVALKQQRDELLAILTAIVESVPHGQSHDFLFAKAKLAIDAAIEKVQK